VVAVVLRLDRPLPDPHRRMRRRHRRCVSESGCSCIRLPGCFVCGVHRAAACSEIATWQRTIPLATTVKQLRDQPTRRTKIASS
jgi:hypothetical protein